MSRAAVQPGTRPDRGGPAATCAPPRRWSPARGTAELDFHRAVLLQNIGQLAEAAAIYHRVLSGPATPPARGAVARTTWP